MVCYVPTMARGYRLDRPAWRFLLLAVVVVSWPVGAIVRLLQSIRFRRVAHQAQGWTWASSNQGIVATQAGGLALELSWNDLARAHWLVHRKPETEGWDEECFALRIAEKGVALSGGGGDLRVILNELKERGMEPRVANGGRGFGGSDGLLAGVWVLIAGVGVPALVLWIAR